MSPLKIASRSICITKGVGQHEARGRLTAAAPTQRDGPTMPHRGLGGSSSSSSTGNKPIIRHHTEFTGGWMGLEGEREENGRRNA